MRVVVDTNVLISGIFFGGLPGGIVTAWRDAALQFVTSPEILSEYADVLRRLGVKRPGIDPYPILALLVANCEWVESPRLSEPVCDDPDDDKFFACAVASGVSVIVSGDSHLLTRSGYREIIVLRPAEIVEQYPELFWATMWNAFGAVTVTVAIDSGSRLNDGRQHTMQHLHAPRASAH